MKIIEYLKIEKKYMKEMAKAFGVSINAVRAWSCGKDRPKFETAKKIVLWSGGQITMSDLGYDGVELTETEKAS